MADPKQAYISTKTAPAAPKTGSEFIEARFGTTLDKQYSPAAVLEPRALAPRPVRYQAEPEAAPMPAPTAPPTARATGQGIVPKVGPGALPVYNRPSENETRVAVSKHLEQGDAVGAHLARMAGTGAPPDQYRSREDWTDDLWERGVGSLAWFGSNLQAPWAWAMYGAGAAGEKVLPARGGMVDAAADAAGAFANINPFVPGSADQWAEMFKNAYDMVESGKLRQMGEASSDADLPFIDTPWSAPKIEGRDVVDIVMPYDLADRMVKDSAGLERPMAAWLDFMNSEAGRTFFGAGLEAMSDPLLGVGKAGAAVKFASKSGDLFTMSRSADRVATAAAIARGGDAAPRFMPEAREAVVSLFGDNVDEAARGEEYLKQASERLLQKADDAERKATAYRAGDPQTAINALEAERADRAQALLEAADRGADTKVIARLEREVRETDTLIELVKSGKHAGSISKIAEKHEGLALAYRTNARRINGFLEGSKSGVSKTGGIAWSLPGSERTRYLLPSPVSSYVTRPVAKVYGWFDDAVARGDDIAQRIRLKELTPSALTPSQYAAYVAHSHGAKALEKSARFVDFLAMVVGTRMWRPLVAGKAMIAANEALGITGSNLLRRVPDSVWQNLQSVFDRFLNRAARDEAGITNAINSWVRAGRETYKNRKRLAPVLEKQARAALSVARSDDERAAAQAMLDTATRWKSGTYTVQSVLDEAAEAVESGAGVMSGQLKTTLDPLVEQLNGIKVAIASKYGRELAEVEQAVSAVTRHAKGNEADYRDLVARMHRAVASGDLGAFGTYSGAQGDELAALIKMTGKDAPKDKILDAMLGAINSNDPTKLIHLEHTKVLARILERTRPKIEFDLMVAHSWYKPRAMAHDLGFGGGAPAALAGVGIRDTVGMAADAAKAAKSSKKAKAVSKRTAELMRLDKKATAPAPTGMTSAEVSEHLDEWEMAVWRDVAALQEAGHHPPQHMMMAALAAIANSPGPGSELYRKILGAYGQVIGTRFGDLPADLAPVVAEMRRILLSYEDAYEKAGVPWVKSQVDRLRDLGVVDYVPHTVKEVTSMASGSKIRAMMSNPREAISTAAKRGPGLDSQFSAAIDAEKKRRIAGTMGEVNAWRRELRHHADEWGEMGRRLNDDKVVRFTADPVLLLARYQAANRMLNGIEMLAEMHDGGVLRVFDNAADALREGYVALFASPERSRDSLFLTAPRDTVRAAREQQDLAGRLIERLRQGDSRSEATVFGEWGGVNRELAQAAQAEDALILARIRLEAGGPLVDGLLETDGLLRAGIVDGMLDYETLFRAAVEAGYDEVDAAREVANIVNRLIADTSVKVAPDWIKPAAWREPAGKLYAPGQVVQAMHNVFGSGEAPGDFARAASAVSNFFKERLTAVRIAFSVRNAISNKFAETIEHGIIHALNPRTNMDSARLATASMVADTFGGGDFDLALEVISKLDSVKGEGFVEGVRSGSDNAYRLLARAGTSAGGIARLRSIAKELGWTKARLVENLGETMDLGDGIPRTINECLALLRENGVINFQYGAGQIDIALAERNMIANLAGEGGIETAKRLASAAEDAIVTSIPLLVGAPPVLLPKAWGTKLASAVENQSRINAFVGTMRQTGSISTASETVNRILFNYGDLTDFQKRFMRILIPFFTWDFKNTRLMAEKMAENPAHFANMDRLFMTDLAAGAGLNVGDEGRKDRKPWAENAYILPTPAVSEGRLAFGDEVFTNIGHPAEAFANNMQLLGGVPGGHDVYSDVDAGRALGKVHFVAKAMAEYGITGEDSFTGRPFAELEPKKTLVLLEALAAVSPAAAMYIGHDVLGDMHLRTGRGTTKAVAGEAGIVAERGLGWSPWSASLNGVARFNSMTSFVNMPDGTWRSNSEDTDYALRLLNVMSALLLDELEPEKARAQRERIRNEAMDAEARSMNAPR